MKTRKRKNQRLLVVGFLFVIFFSASAFGADWGQAPAPIQQQQQKITLPDAKAKIEECAAFRCPEGFSVASCNKPTGEFVCTRNNPNNPCPAGYQVVWGSCQNSQSCDFQCIAQKPNFTCPKGLNSQRTTPCMVRCDKQ